jgi:hypothetical protein
LAAGEVLAGRADRDLLEQPLGGVDRLPGAHNAVEQQPAARHKDAFHLADRSGGAGDRAQGQGADHGVERHVSGGQVLGVALPQIDAAAEADGALTRNGQHRRAQLDAGVSARSRGLRSDPPPVVVSTRGGPVGGS